jgi:hypothetical protein
MELKHRVIDTTGDEEFRTIVEFSEKPLKIEDMLFYAVKYAEDGGCDVIRVVGKSVDSIGRRGNSAGVGTQEVGDKLKSWDRLPEISRFNDTSIIARYQDDGEKYEWLHIHFVFWTARTGRNRDQLLAINIAVPT